jgi:hypothetical protein
MNDAASPSSSARVDARDDLAPLLAVSRDILDRHEASRQGGASAPAPSSRSRAGSHINGRRRKRKSRKKRNPGLVKKLEFVTHLLRSLDTLVFAELSALYYME